MRERFLRIVSYLMVLASAGLAGGAPAEVPQPKPDQALMVIIRPGDPGGGDMVADYVFAEETLIALTKGGTHSFVDHAPGEQMIWCQGGGDLIDLVPGQTYYIVCGFFHGFSLVEAAEGKALVAKTKPGPPVTPKADGGTKKRLQRFYPPMRKSLDEIRAGFPLVPAPARPQDPTGKVDVARYSKVELELMENVSSAHSTTGEKVSFRVAEGSAGGGAPWATPGTPVEGMVMFASPSGRGGKAGILRLDIPSVAAADGTAVPVMGQLITTGESRAAAATWGFALGGLIGSALVKGRDAVYVAGERFDFWTRDDAWIVPPPAPAAVSASRPADVAATLVSPLDPSAFVTRPAIPLQVVIGTDADVASVGLTEVGGWKLPQPVKATLVRRGDKGWTATFEGWSLMRHLRVSDTALPARFQVLLTDGKELIAEAPTMWKRGN